MRKYRGGAEEVRKERDCFWLIELRKVRRGNGVKHWPRKTVGFQ